MIEFSEPHLATDPKLAAAMVGPGGTPAVSHVASLVDDIDAEAERLEAAGSGCFYRSSTSPASAAWFDARAELGHCIEILRRSPRLAEFHEFLRGQAEGWDGREPLRHHA